MTLPMGHPLFLHGGGLGLPAHLTYNALDTIEGQRRADVAQATGLKPERVGRALRALHEIGAAIKDADGLWYRNPAFDPDRTAEAMGLTARRDRRNERLEHEERLHHEAVAAARQRHQNHRPPEDLAV